MKSLFPDRDLRELISEAKRGREESLNEICQALLPVVERLCAIRFPDYLRAKTGKSDLVQESMLGVTESLDTLQGSNESDLLAWVQAIVEHKTQDLRRRYLQAEKRDVTRERALSQQRSSHLGILLEDSSPTPLEKLLSAELATRIQHLMLELPLHYQEVIQLRHRDGLSFPEIAQRVGRTEPSVKNIYVRAVRFLVSELKGG